MGGQGQTEAKELESLMAFWADAGVDASYADAPVNRLTAPRKALEVPARPVAVATALILARAAPFAADIGSAVEEARRAAGAATTLDELKEAIAAFDGCPLKFQGASQSVFARGNPEAPVMIIGEGPGADEDRLGEPFVGRAGKLLDKMLKAAGLEDRVFITNTVFWRPPGNRTPTLAEQAVCRPFLESAVFLIKPKLLLLVGGAASKSVLGADDGIMSLRGRWFEWSDAEKRLILPVLPTLHPAFLLRTPQAKKLAWFDILTFVERLDRPERVP